MEDLKAEEVKGQLKGKDRDTLEEYLRNADLTNSYVRNVMGFCLEHSAAAEEIVEVLTDSLSIPQTPIPTKIARLYIVSDVLHNTTVKGASFFRSSFESQLPGIMSQLNMALNSITGRIRAEYFKKRVLNVIAAWERWSLYPYTYLNTLKEKFLYIPPRPEDSSAPLSEVASTDAVHESRQSKDDLVSPASMQEPNTAEPQRLHSLIPPKAATKAGFKPIGFRPIGNSSTTDTEPTSTRAQKRAADDTPEEPEKKVRIQSKWE
ncbi:hypothetical protein SARC_07341 [Sphaeroforma arctica JP610]|uniref:CID domain-containing protein n=1 Tax=Sphaeroforma arctica JP610 TaxID=667725 RepID=A0A0L0FWG1_9EUKA|nr:hypothetical protein SARC_07341 [Sphaeroforma arctica JP610]KNC80293.1 hypothetical protein SARC_07341 [Sphaeroforma arctica JP610]|eukprot:XP_014154195.1 hypothetical protein SARC_07341 [Sphaeroforma arctica JP610]